MAVNIRIASVDISPNPVAAGQKYKISVAINDIHYALADDDDFFIIDDDGAILIMPDETKNLLADDDDMLLVDDDGFAIEDTEV